MSLYMRTTQSDRVHTHVLIYADNASPDRKQDRSDVLISCPYICGQCGGVHLCPYRWRGDTPRSPQGTAGGRTPVLICDGETRPAPRKGKTG